MSNNPIQPLENSLLILVKTRMPFGKYKDFLLCDLPEDYLIWFSQKGFPEGPLGQQMGLMLEIRANGLEHLLDPIRSQPNDKSHS